MYKKIGMLIVILGLFISCFVQEKKSVYASDEEIDKDGNTSIEDGQSIELNSSVDGIFEYRRDKDFYKIDIKQDGKIIINLKADHGTYLTMLDKNQNLVKSISVRTFINVVDKHKLELTIPKGTYYFQLETSESPQSGWQNYNFSTDFIEKKSKNSKIMWGKTELKVGQIGKVTIMKDTSLVQVKNGELVTVRTLKKGDEFRVYSYQGDNGGLYGVGGGSFVQKNVTAVKYETPSKSKLEQLNR